MKRTSRAKFDPYAELGLDRSASRAEVKAAHRRAVKRAHPDAGGKREHFEGVQRAAKLLLDDKRRERFDRTGQAEEADANSITAKAMGMLGSLALQAINSEANIDVVNIIEGMRLGVAKELANIQKQIEAHRLRAAKMRRTAARFVKRRGGGVNAIGRMIEVEAGRLEAQCDFHDEKLEVLNLALQILADYDYDTDMADMFTTPFGQPMFIRSSWSS
jgi:curved DNA-binding protein CbpA